MKNKVLMPGWLIKALICLGFLLSHNFGLLWAQQGFGPEEDLANAQQKFSRVENAVQRLLEEISSLKAEKAQLEQRLAAPQASHSQELLELKQKYQGEVSGLSEKLKQQESAYEAREKALQELTRERNLLDEKVKSLEKRLAEEDKSGQISRLKEEISSLKAKNAQLEQKVSEPAQKYRQAIAELQLKHQADVAELTKQITNALSERDKFIQARREAIELKEELSAARQESASLREDVSQLKDKVNSLNAKNAELEKDLSAARSKLEIAANMEFKPMRGLAEIDLSQVNKQAHINLGYLYAHSNNPDAAIAEYKKALRYDGEDADAHYNLGWLYAGKGMYPQAIKEFNLSLKSAAYQKEIYYNLTLIYLKYLNDAGKAGEYYRKYMEAPGGD